MRRPRPALDVGLVDLPQDRLQVVLRPPAAGSAAPNSVEVADPPEVVADPRFVAERPAQLAAGDLLAERRSPRASSSCCPGRRRCCRPRPRRGLVVEEQRRRRPGRRCGCCRAPACRCSRRPCSGVAGHGALHQVGEEAVQLRAGVVRARSGSRRGSRRSACRSSGRTPAPARRRPPSRRRTASAACGRSTSSCRCRRSRGGRGQLPARLLLDQRQPVRRVAVDLVGRGEDERRLRAVSCGWPRAG